MPSAAGAAGSASARNSAVRCASSLLPDRRRPHGAAQPSDTEETLVGHVRPRHRPEALPAVAPQRVQAAVVAGAGVGVARWMTNSLVPAAPQFGQHRPRRGWKVGCAAATSAGSTPPSSSAPAGSSGSGWVPVRAGCRAASCRPSCTSEPPAQFEKIRTGRGPSPRSTRAANSTPKALAHYGVPEDSWSGDWKVGVSRMLEGREQKRLA